MYFSRISFFSLVFFLISCAQVPLEGPAQPVPKPAQTQFCEPPVPGTDKKIERKGYVASFNKNHKLSRWVAYSITKEQLDNPVTSREGYPFRPDPEVDAGHPKLYHRSGYDRGHLAPAADMRWSEVAMRESFYMVNIAPQKPQLNRREWSKLEKRVRTLTNKAEKVYVTTGPVFSEIDSSLGENGISIPKKFFKAIMVEKEKRYEIEGYVLPQVPSGHFASYSLPVDEIEKLTGIDLFPCVDAN